jgi:hypothetical protein
MLFESKPAAFGKDLRYAINNTNINDISQIHIPSSAEDKLEFLKSKYWAESCLYYYPVSNIHFLTCCYLGKPLADKLLIMSTAKFIEVGLYKEYFFEVGPNHGTYIPLINSLCKTYNPNEIYHEYKRTIARNMIQLKFNKQTEEYIPLWKIRNAAL